MERGLENLSLVEEDDVTVFNVESAREAVADNGLCLVGQFLATNLCVHIL